MTIVMLFTIMVVICDHLIYPMSGIRFRATTGLQIEKLYPFFLKHIL